MHTRMTALLGKAYSAYAAGFRTGDIEFDKNIDLKISHTMRVCDLILDIANRLHLDDKACCTARVCALFHDIGRYEQFARWGTFADSESEDHGLLGVKVINENNLLAPLTRPVKNIVLAAVENHNKLYIDEDLDEDQIFFTRMLRDADKLDIWKVVLEFYTLPAEKRLASIGLGLADTPVVSGKVCNELLACSMVKSGSLKTLDDLKLLQMGWIYDLNFIPSFEIAVEHDYIRKIFETLPASPVIDEIYRKITSFISLKLARSI